MMSLTKVDILRLMQVVTELLYRHVKHKKSLIILVMHIRLMLMLDDVLRVLREVQEDKSEQKQ